MAHMHIRARRQCSEKYKKANAVWIYQTFSWLGGQEQRYMKGWVMAVPKGHIVLLDLMAEEDE
jgi:hypothetical protein